MRKANELNMNTEDKRKGRVMISMLVFLCYKMLLGWMLYLFSMVWKCCSIKVKHYGSVIYIQE